MSYGVVEESVVDDELAESVDEVSTAEPDVASGEVWVDVSVVVLSMVVVSVAGGSEPVEESVVVVSVEDPGSVEEVESVAEVSPATSPLPESVGAVGAGVTCS